MRRAPILAPLRGQVARLHRGCRRCPLPDAGRRNHPFKQPNLIHRGVGDGFWAMPGGRVAFHETGAETLARELEEEMGREASIGPLCFVIEYFFELAGRPVNEVGFYYEAGLLRPLPFNAAEIVHRIRDGNTDLEFRWPPPTRAVLDQFELVPEPLRDLIETMPDGVQHVVRRDVGQRTRQHGSRCRIGFLEELGLDHLKSPQERRCHHHPGNRSTVACRNYCRTCVGQRLNS